MRICSYPILFLLLLMHFVNAQQLENEIQSLNEDLKNFKYEQVIQKGLFLLEDAHITKSDSLKIYPLMLNASYAQNDTNSAKKIMDALLACDPEFTLNPQYNSPKVIEYFNSYKEKYKTRFLVTTPPDTSAGFQKFLKYRPVSSFNSLMSVLMPGTGHLREGSRQKGYYYAAASGMLLGGLIYTSIKTGDYRDDYMKASVNANYKNLYDKYNSMYKIRNGLISTYVVFSLYVLYDLLSLPPSGQQVSLSPSYWSSTPAIVLSINW